MKEQKNKLGQENNDKDNVTKIPIYNIRQLTDDEWNRLAYRNYLQRKAATVL